MEPEISCNEYRCDMLTFMLYINIQHILYVYIYIYNKALYEYMYLYIHRYVCIFIQGFIFNSQIILITN